jgi:uncharacterized membrane protein
MKCKGRSIGRILLASFFAYAGVMHFLRPKNFIKIMPEMPYKRELVYVSGFFEILGAVGLLVPPVRKPAGIGLIALLWAVFPANVNMAVNNLNFGFVPIWVLWARLPLQFVLMKLVSLVSSETPESKSKLTV